jgi:hypothetical protein
LRLLQRECDWHVAGDVCHNHVEVLVSKAVVNCVWGELGLWRRFDYDMLRQIEGLGEDEKGPE